MLNKKEQDRLLKEIGILPLWPLIKTMLLEYVRSMEAGLKIPFHESGAKESLSYISAQSFVIGQIREMEKFIASIELALTESEKQEEREEEESV